MRLFGTDGLRGKAGEFPLDPASARLVGEEVGRRSGGHPL
jgi:phosphomannomutase